MRRRPRSPAREPRTGSRACAHLCVRSAAPCACPVAQTCSLEARTSRHGRGVVFEKLVPVPVGHAACVRVCRSVTWTAHGIVSSLYICVCIEPPIVSSAYIVRESRLGVGDSARAAAIATDELNTKSAFFGLWPPKSVRTRDRGVMVKARYLSLRSGSAGHRVSWRAHSERAATSAARAEPIGRLCNG